MGTPVHVNEQDTVLLTFVDANGAPAQAPASVIPSWTLDNSALGTINVANDGRSAIFTPAATVTTQTDVNVTAAATMPDGTVLKPATATLTIMVNTPVAIVLTPQTAVAQGSVAAASAVAKLR